jgi:hypothetical protein
MTYTVNSDTYKKIDIQEIKDKSEFPTFTLYRTHLIYHHIKRINNKDVFIKFIKYQKILDEILNM